MRGRALSYNGNAKSELLHLFSERTLGQGANAYDAMRWHVNSLRLQTGCSTRLTQLMPLLRARGIREVEWRADLTCDGCIEPLDTSYGGGFRVLRREAGGRLRATFTLAHEICHTFFYEMVPELKFALHQPDPAEEQLCNFGAAELLVPADDLRTRAPSPPSLQALDELSDWYQVSLGTMAARLRSLRLWDCEISTWHRMTDGSFVVDRIYGKIQADWHWVEESIPAQAWEQRDSRSLTGRTFVHFDDAQGPGGAKKVYYEIKRRSRRLIALWSRRSISPRCRKPRLFGKARFLREGSAEVP